MIRVVALAAVLASVAASSLPVSANPGTTGAAGQAPTFMRVYGTTPAPFGFISFCERTPAECAPFPSAIARTDAEAENLAELDAINRHVNKRIKPVTDLEYYGVQEYWTLPTKYGDCEDYALLKRQMLIKRGWPPSTLLMTVVRDERGDGHAVLTVRTSKGDLILDNKVDDIRIWHKTNYRFVMRQSYVEPRLWMSLVPKGGDHGGPIASAPPRR